MKIKMWPFVKRMEIVKEIHSPYVFISICRSFLSFRSISVQPFVRLSFTSFSVNLNVSSIKSYQFDFDSFVLSISWNTAFNTHICWSLCGLRLRPTAAATLTSLLNVWCQILCIWVCFFVCLYDSIQTTWPQLNMFCFDRNVWIAIVLELNEIRGTKKTSISMGTQSQFRIIVTHAESINGALKQFRNGSKFRIRSRKEIE